MSTTTEQPAPDFGEPWREQTVSFLPGTIENRDGKVVNTREQKLRAIACVNACAGMADPAKEIAFLREFAGRTQELAQQVSTVVVQREAKQAEIDAMREAIGVVAKALRADLYKGHDAAERAKHALTTLKPFLPTK